MGRIFGSPYFLMIRDLVNLKVPLQLNLTLPSPVELRLGRGIFCTFVKSKNINPYV